MRLGHTHEKIDQFFSVVSNKLNSDDGACILTPLGMQQFIKQAVKVESDGYKVIDVKMCEYIYDFGAGITPFVNPYIKNYVVSRQSYQTNLILH